MDRNTEPESAPISTRRRRSIVTMTETQLLSIDLSLMSTEMFPSVAENEKHSPGTTITEKEAGPSTENDQEKGKGPNNDIPVTPIPKYLSGAKLWIVITCVIVVAWLMFLDSSIIVPAIPAITDELHSLQDIGWYGSAYHVSNAAFQPLTGKIYRYFSSKLPLFCPQVWLRPPHDRRSRAHTLVKYCSSLGCLIALMGLVIGLANSGSVCGPVLGGVLTDYANWRWTFYINLPIGGVVLLFLAWCEIPDQVPKPSPMAVIAKLHTYLDFTGFSSCAGAAVSLLMALELGGNEYAFNSPTMIGLFCGSAVALVTFLAWNYRKGDDGLIPSSMAGKRPVWSAAATNFTFVGSAMIQIYLLPLYILPGSTRRHAGPERDQRFAKHLVTASFRLRRRRARYGSLWNYSTYNLSLANVLVTLQVEYVYSAPTRWVSRTHTRLVQASGGQHVIAPPQAPLLARNHYYSGNFWRMEGASRLGLLYLPLLHLPLLHLPLLHLPLLHLPLLHPLSDTGCTRFSKRRL
ncbi:efflux pump [Colletotrichum lupini]|uniref:Efflux pump n=1 Tax=Colletotrichum lupini TaxID=145971 RepID=A0A9Q8SRE2_9PEZI|nr:efflux pump [Colletotrichum lupini]UQC81461.1 efflux pump [Colletotrichum lupini]